MQEIVGMQHKTQSDTKLHSLSKCLTASLTMDNRYKHIYCETHC